VVGTADSALNREVSLTQSALYREVPLYFPYVVCIVLWCPPCVRCPPRAGVPVRDAPLDAYLYLYVAVATVDNVTARDVDPKSIH